MIRFLVLVLHACLVQCLEKHWLPDLEWETAANWADGRVPEVGSRVVFPKDMGHAVGLPKSGEFRMSEIDLPRDGSLVLPANGKLELSSKSETQKEASWNRKGDLIWADPENWDYSSEAVPHLERIPCRTDTMVLPGRNKTFNIRLPRKEVQIRAIRLADEKETLTRWEWQRMKMKREFLQGFFTVSHSYLLSCEDCECQDAAAGLWTEVCEIEIPRCGIPACTYPLKVEGHCCIYCGARITLPPETSLRTVKDAVRKIMEDTGNEVAWHVRKRWNGNGEILLVERGVYDGLSSAKAANILADKIREYGVHVISLELTGPALMDSTLPVILGPLFAMPLFVVIFMLLLFPYYGYSYRQLRQSWREAWSSITDGIRSETPRDSRPFGFVRFENATDANVELASSPSENETNYQAEETLSAGGRFSNPLYRSKRAIAESKDVLKTQGPVTMTDLYDRVGDSDSIEDIEMSVEN